MVSKLAVGRLSCNRLRVKKPPCGSAGQSSHSNRFFGSPGKKSNGRFGQSFGRSGGEGGWQAVVAVCLVHLISAGRIFGFWRNVAGIVFCKANNETRIARHLLANLKRCLRKNLSGKGNDRHPSPVQHGDTRLNWLQRAPCRFCCPGNPVVEQRCASGIRSLSLAIPSLGQGLWGLRFAPLEAEV